MGCLPEEDTILNTTQRKHVFVFIMFTDLMHMSSLFFGDKKLWDCLSIEPRYLDRQDKPLTLPLSYTLNSEHSFFLNMDCVLIGN